MGSCCSISWTPIGSIAIDAYENKEHTDETEYDHHNHNHQNHHNYIQNGDGARVRFHGSSKFLSMYTQQGRKGINQDSMTSWENFNGENDTYFCGVFDGHGPSGHEVSRIVRDNLPTKLSSFLKKSNNIVATSEFFSSWENTIVRSFEDLDEEIGAADSSVNAYSSGSTAVTVIKQGDNLIISNLGDSRAILCTRDDNNKLVPVQLTKDLKPDLPDEAERIRSRKGRIFPMEEEPEVFRVWMPEQDSPGLAMSRSFGDFCLKDFGLIPTPQVSYRKITTKDEFVVLASDGVWDVLSNTEVVKYVGSARKRSIAARLLVERAVQAWKYRYPTSKVDDIAVVCLFFKEHQVDKLDESELNNTFSEEVRPGRHKKLKSDDGLDTVVNCEVTRTHNRGVTRRKQSSHHR
ncbi:probable protein phosphatase 2C 65 [Impatiens glandulifera]|uniref:probable protein phosphatase 2C 65 n=1 Tax=Impatiens glandulifera TaxID=253017 RepID=UPI001FB0E80E|nr:probable protein phosphatase 2C 65 [Impatiens glandulifera]